MRLIKNIFNFRKNSVHRKHFSVYLIDPDYGIYSENYFHEALTYERKRSERSRKPLLLMLVNFKKLIENNGDMAKVRKIARMLATSAREIDITGWYTYGHVIGMILTEINSVDKDVMKAKLYSRFSHIISSEEGKMIEISVHMFPEGNEKNGTDDSKADKNLYPDLSKQKSSQKISSFLKRTMDIFGSIAGIVIFSPLFIMMPILIKLSSKGPVLFKQERLGQFGKRFTFLKFRTMYIDNDQNIHKEYVKKLISGKSENDLDYKESLEKTYKIKDDPRVTHIGRLLRKTSMDELPQFFNVLCGEMSLIGPRPPILYEFKDYDIWHRRRVFEVKPGITGIWQVEGRSSTTFDEMVRLDLQYVRERSLLMDIKILLKTPWAVVKGKGAY